MRNFKNKQLQCLYLQLLFCPPTKYVNHKKKQYRKLGSKFYYPFWQGYDGIKIPLPEKDTFHYVVYIAGVDYKKLNGRNYSIP